MGNSPPTARTASPQSTVTDDFIDFYTPSNAFVKHQLQEARRELRLLKQQAEQVNDDNASPLDSEPINPIDMFHSTPEPVRHQNARFWRDKVLQRRAKVRQNQLYNQELLLMQSHISTCYQQYGVNHRYKCTPLYEAYMRLLAKPPETLCVEERKKFELQQFAASQPSTLPEDELKQIYEEREVARRSFRESLRRDVDAILENSDDELAKGLVQLQRLMTKPIETAQEG